MLLNEGSVPDVAVSEGNCRRGCGCPNRRRKISLDENLLPLPVASLVFGFEGVEEVPMLTFLAIVELVYNFVYVLIIEMPKAVKEGVSEILENLMDKPTDEK